MKRVQAIYLTADLFLYKHDYVSVRQFVSMLAFSHILGQRSNDFRLHRKES